jgi:selenocysteine lyase/cysteine desulfurase
VRELPVEKTMEHDMAHGYDLDAVRANVPVTSEWTYLNTGTVGVMAEPVLAKHLAYIADHERGGHANQARAVAGYERARSALADLLGVAPSEVGLNRNATDGINWVAATFPLTEGDEVITSTEEHPAMIFPWIAACERAGARLRFIPLSHHPDDLRASLEEACNERTRVVALSQVSCETGKRVPVEIVRSIAPPGASILVDASQSVGQFPVSIPDLEADFVIGNGHKWLAGPKGTGFAWFSPGALDLTPPVYIGDGTIEPRWSRAYYQTEPAPHLHFAGTAARFEYGTRPWHTFEALSDAIEYQADLGWDAIFSHVATLSNVAKQMLDEIPGVSVLTPSRWEESSGIVSFAIDGLVGRSVSERLWQEHRIVQRSVEVPSAVRVSVTYFTSQEDITRLGVAVDRLSRGR